MKLRFARPTNDLDQIKQFYINGLGLTQLGDFQDHDGFDGIMLGRAGGSHHLEFTRRDGHTAPRCASEDLLLVFYFASPTEYLHQIASMNAAGFHPVRSLNPYWDQHGQTFEDFEGYRIVIVNGESPV